MVDTRTLIQRIGYFFAIFCGIVLGFWIMPIVVGKNYKNAAGKLSVLPGIAATGGWRSGIVMATYHLLAIVLIAGLVVGVTGGDLVDDGGTASASPDDSPSDEPATNESDDTDDGEESTNETDGDDDDDEDTVDRTTSRVTIEVLRATDNEDLDRYRYFDSGTLYINNSLGETVATMDLAERNGETFDNLTAGETYTAAVPKPGGGFFPPAERRFDPETTNDIEWEIGWATKQTFSSYRYIALMEEVREPPEQNQMFVKTLVTADNGEGPGGFFEGEVWTEYGPSRGLSDGHLIEAYKPADADYWYENIRGWEIGDGQFPNNLPINGFFSLGIHDDNFNATYQHTTTWSEPLTNRTLRNRTEILDGYDPANFQYNMAQYRRLADEYENEREVYVYNVSEGYRDRLRNATIYVDTETKYVIGVEGEVVAGDEVTKLTVDAWDHGEVDHVGEQNEEWIDVEPPEEDS